MCGHFGGISPYLANDELVIVQHLGVLATLRGLDGAGVICVPQKEKHKMDIIRTTELVPDLMFGADFNKSVNRKTAAVIGHSRAATTGDYTIDDIHPHEYKHIIGMHNGTLSEINGEKIKKGVNDSRLLFQCLADQGVHETVKKLKGSYCLVWIDKTDNSLNFLRNKERFLYFASPKANDGVIFWASEAMMLDFVLARSASKTEYQIRKLPENRWVSFKLRNHGECHWTRSEEVKQPEVQQDNSPFPSTVNKAPSTGTTGTASPSASKTSVPQTTIFHFGEQVPFNDIKELMLAGCANCNHQADTHEYWASKVHWIGKTEFICDDCYTTDGIMRGMADAFKHPGGLG